MASTSPNSRSPLARWWKRWWPYLLVLLVLVLFPFVAGLTMGKPDAVQEGANSRKGGAEAKG